MSRAGRKHAAAKATAAQLSPLTTFMQGVLLDEVYEQCTYVLLATGELRRATNALPVTKSVADMTVAWYAIQNLMVASANVSKVLWGDYEAPTQQQRQPLRKILKVTQNSPLKRRSLRNHLEHVDSRIIAFLEDPAMKGRFVTRNIGPPDSIKGTQAPRFSHYDHTTGLLTFWRESVSLPALLAEVERILPLAEVARRRR